MLVNIDYNVFIMNNIEKQFVSTSELASILGVSRVTVFKMIKRGEIEAKKVGRNFIINKDELPIIFGRKLSGSQKDLVEKSVSKTVEEYGETLRLLGKE